MVVLTDSLKTAGYFRTGICDGMGLGVPSTEAKWFLKN